VLGEDSAFFARSLAARFRYPRTESPELPRVSQYAAALGGYGPLYDELRALVTADDAPTTVHTFFASLPPLLREAGAPHQLLVTTSYGRALERAFHAAGEQFDVVSYIASGRSRGSFRHTAPDGTSRVIDVPNTYATELSLAQRTVILKMRGQVDPSDDSTRDGFVVTEDDYIDYLGRADVSGGVPSGSPRPSGEAISSSSATPCATGTSASRSGGCGATCPSRTGRGPCTRIPVPRSTSCGAGSTST